MRKREHSRYTCAQLSGSGSSEQSSERRRHDEDPQLCFVLMPRGRQKLAEMYELYLKPAVEGTGALRCERANEIVGTSVVVDDIERGILRARIVIADLTGKNPNVLYEVGMADAFQKKVLLLAQSKRDVPFDLEHRRVLLYKFTPSGCMALKDGIVKSLAAVLA